MLRDAAGVITSIDDSVTDLLGWGTDQLVGSPSTRFIHPRDQPRAITAWMEMITSPGATRVWRGRYRAADGTWIWVETINCNLLEEPEIAAVRTSMAPIAADELSVEEELQAREHLLSQLSDALPVGLVQIDTERRITLTNTRLHSIMNTREAGSVDDLFKDVVPEDGPTLSAALADVLAGHPIDDVELTVGHAPERVVSVSFRTLTDPDDMVTGVIGCVNDVTDQVRMRRQLELRASVDELTSCLNRRAILELLRGTLAERTGSAGTAVVFVDLDNFKAINDRCGHAAGDEVLMEVSRRLRTAVRGIDQVGRIGGDEFLVVCPHVDSADSATEIGRRVTDALHADLRTQRGRLSLRASVGVAFTTDEIEPDTLTARADDAMYQSKRSGQADTVRCVVVARDDRAELDEGRRSGSVVRGSG